MSQDQKFDAEITAPITIKLTDKTTGLVIESKDINLTVTPQPAVVPPVVVPPVVTNDTIAWIEAKLGTPAPAGVETRPLVWEPPHRPTTEGYANVIQPWETGNFVDAKDPSKGMVGPHVAPVGDFWRDSANVALARPGGLIRAQTDSFDKEVHTESSRYDVSGGDPDPHRDVYGGQTAYVVATCRSSASITNEALILYDNGTLGLAGTQTSRNWDAGEQNFPRIVFPSTLKPRGVALTTGNELALVALQDTLTGKGKVAVIAMEAKYLCDQTWPWLGLLNQGSWSDMRLLGFVDLPFAEPDAIDAASNGYFAGPSQTNNKKLSQIDIGESGAHRAIFQGAEMDNWGYAQLVATGGYFIVSSKVSNVYALYDLKKLFGYIRSYYATKEGVFPPTFAATPAIIPTLAFTKPATRPTAVLAGKLVDSWSQDVLKAYVAMEDGTIQIVNTSALIARFVRERVAALGEIGSFKVGANPTCLCWARDNTTGLPLIPPHSPTQGKPADGFNNHFIVCSRASREIQFCVTFNGQGQVYRKIVDSRLVDPVAVWRNHREPVITVCDYTGQKLVNYRIGAVTERVFTGWGQSGPVHYCGPDNKDNLECGGVLALNGKPWLITSSNVN